MSLENEINRIVATTLGIDINQIKPNIRFNEDLRADDISTGRVLLDVAAAYHLSIKNESLGDIKTVRDLHNYILGRICVLN